MTWTKITDTFVTDPAMVELPVSLRWLVLEALVYGNTHLTDGRITVASLQALTRHRDPESAADALVAAGLWDVHPDGGWQVVAFLSDQRSRADVLADRVANAERQTRWREVQRLHGQGDHSRCSSKCLARNGVSNVSSNAPPVQSSPVLTRKGSGSGLVDTATPDGSGVDDQDKRECHDDDCDGMGWHNRSDGTVTHCPTVRGAQ